MVENCNLSAVAQQAAILKHKTVSKLEKEKIDPGPWDSLLLDPVVFWLPARKRDQPSTKNWGQIVRADDALHVPREYELIYYSYKAAF